MSKKGPKYSSQVVSSQHQRQNGQSIAKPGTPQYNILAENTNLIQMNSIVTIKLNIVQSIILKEG